MYEYLLWAPIKNKLKNKDRFLFMFAPISRSFELSYNDIKEIPKAPEFELNNTNMPNEIDGILSLFKEWIAVINSNSHVYDYHDELYKLFILPRTETNPLLASNMEKVTDILAELKELIRNRKPTYHPVQTLMWEKLNIFVDYTEIFARILQL